MKHTLYHYLPPYVSTTRDDQYYRESLWMDPDEIAQRDDIDRKLIVFSRNAGILTEVKGRLVRAEYSESTPQSVVLNTNYRYVLKDTEIETFMKSVGSLSDLVIDLHIRLGVGYAPSLLDKLITRTYGALTVLPTESNLTGQVDHAVFPAHWVFPYLKTRLHEVLSVGIQKD